MSDILPNSVPKITKRIFRANVPWILIFCANCGKDGGAVPEEASDFAFYLCDPCAATWVDLVGHYLVPDEVFWQKVNDAQIEKYGRILQPNEIVEALKDPNHMLSKLSKDRASFKKG